MWRCLASLQLVVLIFVLVMNSIRICCSENIKFINRGICQIEQEPQSTNYTMIQETKVDAIQCARLCWQDGQCVGFNHPGKGTGNCTLRHNSPTFTEICLEPDTDDIFMQKDGICYNGGRWSYASRSCICTHAASWVGDHCSSIAVACDDFTPAGYSLTTRFIRANPFGVPYRINTYCSRVPGEEATRGGFGLFFPASSPSFNKSWDDMENGFEEGNTYWIGLKAMRYHLEKVKHKKYYLALRIDEAYEPTFIFTYYGFHLSNASDGYRLTFSHSKVEAPKLLANETAQLTDCLLESNGSRFSTFDRDMDNDPTENCALKSNAAFWYNGCHPKCHPLAVSYDTESPKAFHVTLPQFRTLSLDFSNLMLWAGNFHRSHMTLVVEH